MLDAPMLDMISTILCALRGNNIPFGGLCVVLVGDFFQLPPVGTSLLSAALPPVGWSEDDLPVHDGDYSTSTSASSHALMSTRAGHLFRTFERMELLPHAHGRAQCRILQDVLNAFRNREGRSPITPTVLRAFKTFSPADVAGNREVTAALHILCQYVHTTGTSLYASFIRVYCSVLPLVTSCCRW